MIWLTGNKGMLGRDIERLLKNDGAEFISSDREVDIGSREAVEQFLCAQKIKWIINAAAYTDVDGAESDPETAFRVNAEAVRNLAEAALSRKAAIIHISTDYVFDGKNKEGYGEDDETNPLNVYGMSKLKGEMYLRDILPQHYTIRTSWLYGGGGRNFVFSMLELLKSRKELRVVSDQTGSPTYASDLAEVIINLVNREKPEYGTYNFSNSDSCSWYDFACEIYRQGRELGILTKEVKLIPVDSSAFPRPAARPAYSLLKKEKIKKTLGISPRPWKDALGAFLCSVESGGKNGDAPLSVKGFASRTIDNGKE